MVLVVQQDLDPKEIDDVTKFHGGVAYDLYRGIIGPFEGRLRVSGANFRAVKLVLR